MPFATAYERIDQIEILTPKTTILPEGEEETPSSASPPPVEEVVIVVVEEKLPPECYYG